MKKRIMALILCISILCGLLPSDVYAVSPEVAGEKTTLSGNSAHSGENEESEEVEEAEEAEVTEVNQLGYFNGTSVKLYYDLSTPEQYEELTSESDSWPVAFMVLSSMVYNEETWYILENDFTGNGATFVNSESVSLGTPEFEKYTGDGNIDDTAVFDTESYLNFVVTEDPTTYQHDLTSSGYISSLEPDDIFDLTAEENTFTMIITDYYWDSNSSALWYQVEAAEGGSLPEAMGDKNWVFQCYTHDAMQAGAANQLIITETVKDICDVCGKENCTDSLHFYCTVCEVYNCGLEHLYCNVCSDYDCDKTHVYCGICADYDCGLEHEEMNSPLTAPVIPENPVMTEGEDVSLVDEYGNPVTAEDGMILSEGMKVSLSAWSELENTSDVSWQWQICYDNEKDLWADIYGQTGKGILLSPAMIFSITGESGYAPIRCVMTTGKETQTSAAIHLMLAPQAVAFKARKASVAPIDDTTTPDELKKGYVVVQYVYEDGRTAAATTFAEISPEAAFSYSDKLPEIVGYKATLNTHNYGDAVKIEGNTLKLDFAAGTLKEEYTIFTVTYRPDYVNYTVIHYWQNVDNDNYTEHERVTISDTHKTGQLIENVHKSYPGFYNLLYETPTAAADGSTVIEVYYDRYYYLMTFDLGDMGYGVDPIYARYETPVEIGTPTREGYTFVGWDLAVIDSDQDGKLDTGDGVAETAMPTTMPEENRKYVALWKTNETAKVSVVFWGENANDEGYSYLTTGVVEIKPGTQYTFSEGETVFLICGKEEHTHVTECGPKCGKEEHLIHTDECLGNCTHSEHTLACYSAVYWGLKETKEPAQIINVGGDGVYSYSTGSGYRKQTHYYLYLDGKWYCAQGWDGNDDDTTEIILSCTHTHTESCYTCEYHEHTIACYSCGKEEHSHTSECNQNGSGLDSDLWTFVKSDTVTVDADGSTVVNVYYDRKTFTLTFREDGYTVATITDKWGASISDEFEKDPFNTTYNGRAWKCTDSNKYGYALQTLDIMPQFNATFNLYNKSSDTLKTIYYYVENVGANVSDSEWPDNSNGFTLLKKVDTYFTYATYEEEYHEMEGFTRYSKQISGFNNNRKDFSNKQLYLYYLRNSYTLDFNNGYEIVKSENVEYEDTLEQFVAYIPPAPSSYEPGSVKFAGWYLNPECTGEQVNLKTYKMPCSNLVLYAKWELVSHKVNYYLTKDSLDRGETIPMEMKRLVEEALGAGTINEKPEDSYSTVFEEDIVLHGQYITGINTPGVTKGYEKIHPRAGYTFVGWFYINDEGKETAFDPENMPVNRDLNLYAKWSSNVLCKYNVYFALDEDKDGIADTDEKGNIIYIADAISGSGIAGHTFTFKAKGGEELYENYQEGYFPTVGSHSMIIDITDEDGIDENKYTFLYQQKLAVPYTVYYLTDNQNEEGTLNEVEVNGKTYYQVAAKKNVEDNKNVVVTENFVYVAGYLPDKYQKTLVVSGAEGAENVIIFYYTEDTQHALYVVNHYIQELNSDLEHTGWSKYTDLQNIGDIGTEYTATALNIDGFTLSVEYTDRYNVTEKINGAEDNILPTVVSKLTDETLSGELGEQGMELNFYYTRNLYPYEFRYMLNGTTTELAEPVFGKAAYDSLVTGAAKEIQMDIDGDGINEDYRLYDPTETSKDIHIKVDGEPLASDAVVTKSQAKVNVETFYYVRCTQTMTIKKQVVDNCSFSDPDSNQEFKMSLLIHAKSGYHQTSYKYTKSDGTSETSGTLSPVASAPNTLEFTLKADEKITIEGLPTAEYTVSEVDLPVGYYDSYAPAPTNKLTVDQQLDVTVTNTYEPSELKISKKVVAGGDYNIPSAYDQEFTFTVTFSGGGTYTFMKGDTSGTLTSGGTLTLKHGETALFEKLPAGVTYTVKETAVDGFTADKKTKTGTLVGNQSTEAAFINTYTEELGNLTITKKIVKEYENDVIPGGTFTFTVTGTTDARPGTYKATIGSRTQEIKVGNECVIESFTVDVTVPENGNSNSIEISNLPVGSYTVTENALDGYKCDTAVKEVAVKESENAEITVTNTYSRTTGSLTINKKIINKSYDAINNKAFTFVVTVPDGVTIPAEGYQVNGGTFAAIADNNKQFQVTVTASAEAMKEGTVNSVTISGLPSGDYTVQEELQTGAGYTADFGNGATSATVHIRQSNETVTCTNTYEPESYIAVTKQLAFVGNVTEEQKKNIISSYSGKTVEFSLLDSKGETVAKAEATIKANGTFEAAKFMSLSDPSKVYFPVRNETYTVKETSTHNVSGFFWTHADATVNVDENIEDKVVYTNTYTRPEITITKNVSANDKDGNALSKDKIKELIETYGANGVYKATFNLLDYATKEEAGTLEISFAAEKLEDDSARTAKVQLNDEYLAKHQNNADIKLIIQEDHTDGKTTIFGNDHPGVSFENSKADTIVNLSQEKNTDGQPVYVITLTKENPDAQIICENVYPPVSYIAVQKKLTVDGKTEIPTDIKTHYEKKNVEFTLYENYGETAQKEVAHAYPQFDKETGTFTKATFVVDGSGNPFVPVYDTEYTIVETSLHRIGGYVWAKIGDTNSTVITVEASTTQPVVEKEFTNQYTTADVGVEVEKTLVFYADEKGNTGLSKEQIQDLLAKSDSEDNTYKANFGLYIVPNGETTKVDDKCTKIGEATASFKIEDFNEGYTATQTLKFTGIAGIDSADLDAYLKELGASTEQTHLLIYEDSASTIDGKPIDLEFEQTSFVLGGSDTDNQKYYNKATFENIYPPRLLTTSLKIVKEAEGNLKIPDGEQFIFKVQTTYNGVTSTRNVVLEWDNTKDENSIIINNVSLNTAVIVETGWGWRYEPTDDDKDGNPDTMKLVNVSMNAAQNVITFTNTLNEEQWLDTQTRVDNQFESVPESETTQ